MNADSKNKVLTTIKKIEWKKASVAFYVVKRTLNDMKAFYSVKQVRIEERLRLELSELVCKFIDAANRIADYDFFTADHDDDLLMIDKNETDLVKIIDSISGAEVVGEIHSLSDSWMYIIQLKVGKYELMAFRKLSNEWSTKKAISWMNVFFSDFELKCLERDNLFRISKKIDFFTFNDKALILNKKAFEAALNFRKGMLSKMNNFVDYCQKERVVDDIEILKKFVGTNMQRLRKISQIEKEGYYKNPDYIEQIRRANEKNNWGLEFNADGAIIVKESKMELLLKVLNNDRMQSQINGELFDASIKTKQELPSRN